MPRNKQFMDWWNRNWPDLAPTHQALHAFEAGRIQGLEEAAKMADSTAEHLANTHHWSGAPNLHARDFRNLAAAIRTNKEQPRQGFCDFGHNYPAPTMEGQKSQYPHLKQASCINWKAAAIREKKEQ